MENAEPLLLVSQHYAPEVTGNAPYVAALARALHAKGREVCVVTTFPHYPDWRLGSDATWARVDRVDGVEVRRLRHYVPTHPSTLRRLLSELSFGARVWFTRWPAQAKLMLVTPGLFSSALVRMRRPGSDTTIWVQDLYSLGMTETRNGPSWLSRLVTAAERWTLGRGARVVVIHDRFKRHVVDQLGLDEANVTVIRNWTHLTTSSISPDHREVRNRHGWSSEETIILHAGNQGVKQGLDNVVEAARYADAEQIPVRFVLLGGGNQHRHLVESARGIARIQFLGSLSDSDYQAAMHASDLLLVNEREGVSEMSVPSKLTSYFTAGRPVIARTDPGGVTAEEVALSGAGISVSSTDPADLVAAAIELVENRELYTQLSGAGPAFVSAHLMETAAVEAFESALFPDP
ncbi:glycosyltransferase family 4 protein [Microbacterium plantarum]|uniref:Glycosyltransferase family 4 protein n=1 Tax=Microbacterium plantarum TaxID=1816425 RepID=A0ABV5EVV2_9MICO